MKNTPQIAVVLSLLLFMTTSFKQKIPGAKPQDNALIQKSKLEDRIVDTILKLPEVQRRNRYIDSFSHHKHGISIWIVEKPNKSQKYYWIKAGYNGDMRYETYFNFHV